MDGEGETETEREGGRNAAAEDKITKHKTSMKTVLGRPFKEVNVKESLKPLT